MAVFRGCVPPSRSRSARRPRSRVMQSEGEMDDVPHSSQRTGLVPKRSTWRVTVSGEHLSRPLGYGKPYCTLSCWHKSG